MYDTLKIIKKSLLLVSLLVLLSGFSRCTANFVGFCTPGWDVTRWNIVRHELVLSHMQQNARRYNGAETSYEIVNINEIASDKVVYPSITDKIFGQARLTVHYELPASVTAGLLYPDGYFSVPNCLEGWIPPR